MNTNSILAELKGERDRINHAIEAIESIDGFRRGKRRGRPPKSLSAARSTNARRRRNSLTPTGRKKLSQMMKARWAAYRKKKAQTA